MNRIVLAPDCTLMRWRSSVADVLPLHAFMLWPSRTFTLIDCTRSSRPPPSALDAGCAYGR